MVAKKVKDIYDMAKKGDGDNSNLISKEEQE